MKHENREHFLFSLSSQQVQQILQRFSIQILEPHNEHFPPLLKEIHDPPLVLFTQGLPRKDIRYVAVVGTRKPSTYGVLCTQRMVRALVEAGFGIVSGLAHGIDTVAHRTTIEAGGHTVAVIAQGHGALTAREKQLADHIVAGGGVVVSEQLPTTHAARFSFPIRNRIIAGIAEAVLIPEATLKSGTMITAQCAVRENRDVFAIPGPITSSLSEGPHALIADGAACIYSTSALHQALGIHTSTQLPLALPSLSPQEHQIFTLIKEGSEHLDQLLESSSLTLGELSLILRQLTQKSLIVALPGNRFSARL